MSRRADGYKGAVLSRCERSVKNVKCHPFYKFFVIFFSYYVTRPLQNQDENQAAQSRITPCIF